MAQVTRLEAAAEKIARRGLPPTHSALPVIRHDPGQLPAVLDALQDALASAATDLNLYSYGGRLARVWPADTASAEHGVRRAAGAVLVHPVEAPLLVELAGRAATHEKFDGRAMAYKPCDCPKRVADALLARYCWHGIPELAGFVETPQPFRQRTALSTRRATTPLPDSSAPSPRSLDIPRRPISRLRRWPRRPPASL
jgi:hypothetical protein